MNANDAKFERARRLTRIEFRLHPTDTPELQEYQTTQHLANHSPVNVTWRETLWRVGAHADPYRGGIGKMIGLTPNFEAACRFADMGTRYFNTLVGCDIRQRYNFCEAQAVLDILNYPEARQLLSDWAKSFGLNPNLYAIQT